MQPARGLGHDDRDRRPGRTAARPVGNHQRPPQPRQFIVQPGRAVIATMPEPASHVTSITPGQYWPAGCSPSLRMSMTATFSVAMCGREKPRRAGAGRGWWWTGWRGGGQSVAAAASSLMAARAEESSTLVLPVAHRPRPAWLVELRDGESAESAGPGKAEPTSPGPSAAQGLSFPALITRPRERVVHYDQPAGAHPRHDLPPVAEVAAVREGPSLLSSCPAVKRGFWLTRHSDLPPSVW